MIDGDRLARVLSVSRSELSAAIGPPLSDTFAIADWVSPVVQAGLSEVAHIIDRVLAWCGSPPQAFEWFRSQPIPGFGCKTAGDLVRGGRAEDVLSYLDGIAVGGFA
ncbi:DUF2384 domain-containing protein [Acidisphaera sp. S103]|uniref:DUF2384 domain-containing protein n=1 Tax=Acidisphaera sp. S103 TaxID=1747223 RepID=UPI00131D74CE|nr:DUF2384 domain-containing protein [Acidisphaera sp. S103]